MALFISPKSSTSCGYLSATLVQYGRYPIVIPDPVSNTPRIVGRCRQRVWSPGPTGKSMCGSLSVTATAYGFRVMFALRVLTTVKGSGVEASCPFPNFPGCCDWHCFWCLFLVGPVVLVFPCHPQWRTCRCRYRKVLKWSTSNCK